MLSYAQYSECMHSYEQYAQYSECMLSYAQYAQYSECILLVIISVSISSVRFTAEIKQEVKVI